MPLTQRLKYLTAILFLITVHMQLSCAPAQSQGSGLAFMRINEPQEAAFSILMPQGWQTEGGIFRVNPLQAGGPLNAMEAKCNLILKSDAQGTVYFRIYPDIVYAHVGIGGGFFPAGANYQGAEIRQLQNAQAHLQQLFSAMHPQAANLQVIKIAQLPGEKQSIDQGLALTNQLLTQIGLQGMTFQSDAAGGVFEYEEGGRRFREVMLTGLIDMRGALTWKNTRTLSFRAPVEEFEQWRPAMDVIRNSIKFNPQWILKESEGQRQRADIVQKVFDEVRRIDQEILTKTTVNREEIMNDNFLVLTEQEEFVNPHTNEIEVDTDAYKFRWTTPGGDTYYTNKESEDPNIFLQRTDYKRTPIRKRRNE